MAISVESDFANLKVVVSLDHRDEVLPLTSSARQQGFLLLQHRDKATKPFIPHDIELTCEDGFRFSFAARPVQFFDKNELWETVWQLEPWTAEQDAALAAALKGASSPGPQPSDEAGARDEAGGDEGEVRGASPTFRLKAMDPNERARLAMSAGRTERQLLRRDRSPQVLLNLLSNPRVEAEDVLAIVKSPAANAGLLDRVVKDRRWSQNAEIRTAVARNPKTPSPTVIRLLDTLRTDDLRQMAKVGALRENVRREALRVYMKRTGAR